MLTTSVKYILTRSMMFSTRNLARLTCLCAGLVRQEKMTAPTFVFYKWKSNYVMKYHVYFLAYVELNSIVLHHDRKQFNSFHLIYNM